MLRVHCLDVLILHCAVSVHSRFSLFAQHYAIAYKKNPQMMKSIHRKGMQQLENSIKVITWIHVLAFKVPIVWSYSPYSPFTVWDWPYCTLRTTFLSLSICLIYATTILAKLQFEQLMASSHITFGTIPEGHYF